MATLGATIFTNFNVSPPITRADESRVWKFDFGGGPAATGYRVVSPETRYNAARGFGFEGDDNIQSGRASSFFSANVPEGVYDVTLTFGDPNCPTNTTIKAEVRRLMLHRVVTVPGQFVRRTFTVSVKRDRLKNGQRLSLKPSQGALDWDEKLTLEFNGPHPGVRAVEISPAQNPVTLFLAGDSTVTNQKAEPYKGWGQVLPCFFKHGIAVHNGAESGAAMTTFEESGLLQKIWDWAQPGDYLFLQFGHNDQKDKSPGAGPFTSYKANLKRYIESARERKLKVVLVTSMERRRFDGDKLVPSLSDYAEAVRQTGWEESVPVIDLNAASIQFFEALGPEESKKALVHYPAHTFPNQPEALQDNTHFNTYGAYEMAQIVATGIHNAQLDMARFLIDGFESFDPERPDDPGVLALPMSPFRSAAQPEGN